MLNEEKWSGYNIDRLSSSETGIKYDILVVADKYFESPVVKMIDEYKRWVILSIDGPTMELPESQTIFDDEEMKELKSWISSNRTILLQYWNGDISTPQLINRLKKL